MDLKQVTEGLDQAIGISAFGGVAHYLYQISKGEKFYITQFVINIFLAGFIGYIVSKFIPPGSDLYGAILAISGFCTYPLLKLMEEKGPVLLQAFIQKK